MKRFLASLLAIAMATASLYGAGFDFRTTGTTTTEVFNFRPAATAPAVSDPGWGKIFVPGAIGGFNSGNFYISQNGGSWVLLSSFVGSGAVSSVFGRTGAVSAVSGDYTATLVTSTATGDVAATNVQAAIAELAAEKIATLSPALTGVPTTPTAAPGTNTTQIASTAFATTADNLKANLASPTLTGVPATPTAAPGTSTTQIASTAFATTADDLKANLASPTLTGIPAAATAAPGTNTTQLATTAFATTADNLKSNISSPTFTGVPAAATAAPGTSTTQLATTAFVDAEAVAKAGDTMTGPLGIPVGSLAATSLQFTSDPNTGVYSPGADQVALVTAGVARVTVDSIGDVSIVDNAASLGPELTIKNTNTGGWAPSLKFNAYGYAGGSPAQFDLFNIRTSYAGGGGSATSFLTKAQPESTAITAVTILGDGKVGIGTAEPSNVWTVVYPFARTDTTAREIAAFSSNEALASNPQQLVIQSVGHAAQANRYFEFVTRQYGTGAGGNVVFHGAGGAGNNVAIGNTLASARLHVGAGGAGTNAEELRVDSGSGSAAFSALGLYRGGVYKASALVVGSAGQSIAGSAINDLAITSTQAILFSADAGTSKHVSFAPSLYTFGKGGTGGQNETITINAATGSPGTPYLQFERNSIAKAAVGVDGVAGALIAGSAANDLTIRNSQAILRSADGGTTLHETLSNTGNIKWSGTVTERNRSTPIGEWIAPTFAAGDFTASGAMTWTLTAGDVGTFAYTLVGKTMTVSWGLLTTTVGGTLSTQLKILIPGGFTAAKGMYNSFMYFDNGGTFTHGFAQVNAGNTQIILSKMAGTNWSAATNTTEAYGQITFEVQFLLLFLIRRRRKILDSVPEQLAA